MNTYYGPLTRKDDLDLIEGKFTGHEGKPIARYHREWAIAKIDMGEKFYAVIEKGCFHGYTTVLGSGEILFPISSLVLRGEQLTMKGVG